MASRKKSLLLPGTALIGLMAVILLASGMAGAASGRSTMSAQPTAAPTSGKGAIVTAPHTAHAPKGYQVVNSDSLDNPAGSESDGSATCPAGTVLWGGGVTDSGGVEETINSSWPVSTVEWGVYIENTGSSDDSFVVYAVCAKKPKQYIIESNSADAGAGIQTGLDAECPAKTVVLGGGALSDGIGSAYTINTTYPYENYWVSDMNNAGSGDETVGDFAICGKKPSKYVVVTGSAVDNPPGGNDEATALCPSAKTSVLSAGLYSSSSAIDVSVNELVPYTPTDAAAGYEANNSVNDYSITAYAICAK
jgi:hypothetical protein